MEISISEMAKKHQTLADYFGSPKAMSRTEAAKRWHVTEATVSRWVSGSRRPRGQQAVTIAQDTGVPLSVLIGGKEAA